MINESRRRPFLVGVLVGVNVAILDVQMSIGQGYSLYVQKNSRYSFVHEFSKLLLVEIKRLFSACI